MLQANCTAHHKKVRYSHSCDAENTSLLGCYTLSTGKYTYLPTFRRHDDPLQNIGNVTTFEVFSFRSGVTQNTVALRYKVASRGSIVFLYLWF
jgi:hypothetical protein